MEPMESTEAEDARLDGVGIPQGMRLEGLSWQHDLDSF